MKDVVCGMETNSNSKFKKDYNGETFYFCSPACMDSFASNPQKFVK